MSDITARLGRRWLGSLLLVGCYTELLRYAYEEKVAPVSAGLNLYYRAPAPFDYAVALAIVAGLTLVMPRRLRRPSDLILWILFVMVVVPSILVPQYCDILPPDGSFELALVVGALFLMVVVIGGNGPRGVLRWNLPGSSVWIVVGVVSVLVYCYLAVTTGLSIRLVSLLDVRAMRFEYRDQVLANGPLLGYLVRLQGNVLNPLIIVRGCQTRSWRLVALGCLGQVLIFSVTGFKLVLLSIPAVLLVVLLLRWRPRIDGRAVLVGVVGIVAIALVVDGWTGGRGYTELFVNRLLLTPGILTAGHVMVFNQYDKAEWAHSFMAPFLDYPHWASPDFMVGAVLFGSPETSANANLFADGYSNFGYFGMLIEALVLIGLLWTVDSAARHLPLAVSAAVLLVPTLALVNSSVFTSILTSGFGYAVVVMAAVPAGGPPVSRSTEVARPISV